MAILWPDAVGNYKLFHVDVHEAGICEPLLQLGSWGGRIAGSVGRTLEFVIVPLEPCAVHTAVFRFRGGVPVSELDPAAGLD